MQLSLRAVRLTVLMTCENLPDERKPVSITRHQKGYPYRVSSAVQPLGGVMRRRVLRWRPNCCQLGGTGSENILFSINTETSATKWLVSIQRLE